MTSTGAQPAEPPDRSPDPRPAPSPGSEPRGGAPAVLVARLAGDQDALTAAALHALLVRGPGTGGR